MTVETCSSQVREIVELFSNNIAKTFSYGLNISKNIEIKYLFHLKTYFHVTDTFHKSCKLRKSIINYLNPQFPADLVTFTKEILKGKLHFLCSAL